MINKWFILFTVLLCGSVKAQENWGADFDSELETERINFRCNQTFCEIPCSGNTSPPTSCPKDMPNCSSNCVCVYRCGTYQPQVECFLADYCRGFRRFLKKIPYQPPYLMTTENLNNNFDQISK